MKQDKMIDDYFKEHIQPRWKDIDKTSKDIIQNLIELIKSSSVNCEDEYFLDSDKKQWDIAIKTLYSYESDTPEIYRNKNKKTYNYLKKLPLIYDCIEDDELGNYLMKKKEYLVLKARERSLIDEGILKQSLEDFYFKLYKDSDE
jgi:hypothetical protein